MTRPLDLCHYPQSGVVMTPECPEMAANDIGREGLVALIMLIGLWECVMSLVAEIVIHIFV